MKLKRFAKLVVLHVAKVAGVLALLRAVTRTQARVLCYHGGNIGDECHFNPKLFCTAEHLEQRLRWLRAKGFVPTSLDEAANLRPRVNTGIPVALTLDDGWYSSGRDLLPLMAKYAHRPVLYLHTEVYETGTPVIPVCLGYIFWKAGPKKVTLAGFDPAMDGHWQLADPVQQRRLRAAAEAWLGEQSPRLLAECIERFATALGLPASSLDLSSRRFSYMTNEELHAAVAAGCTIEMHGHAHKYIVGEPASNRMNIEACRARILDAGLDQPRHYCYPSGVFDAEAANTLRALNIATATTCLPGLIAADDTDARFFLPRFLDGGNVSMIEFEAEMSGLLHVIRALLKRRSMRNVVVQESELELTHSSV